MGFCGVVFYTVYHIGVVGMKLRDIKFLNYLINLIMY